MPLDYFHGRWHFHQRMNKKVSNNLTRLRALIAKNPSKEEILDALHPWRTSIQLKYNNTFVTLQFVLGVILFLIGLFWMLSLGGWAILFWLSGIGICTYAGFFFEKQSEIDEVIKQLQDLVFQDQYQIKFNHFPNIDQHMLNPTRILMQIKHGFDCLNEGNASNNIEFFASTTWQIDCEDYPVLLFHYKFSNENAVKDQHQNIIKKEVTSHRYGAVVFNQQALAFMVSNKQSTYPRYPIKWSSSDIQFNRQFNIAGQQELELARNLTPHRILALAENLQHLQGTLMFHDQLNALCYVSTQHIFEPLKPKKPITDISMLRGYLRTLNAIHYERMQHSLTQIIERFKDEEHLHGMKNKH